MKTLCLSFCVLVVCCTTAEAQPGKGKVVQKPAPAASAASAVQPGSTVRTSPAVRANEESQVPGDFRPEKRVVPQVAIPLRRDREPGAAAAASSAASPGQVDDTAARRAANRPKK